MNTSRNLLPLLLLPPLVWLFPVASVASASEPALSFNLPQLPSDAAHSQPTIQLQGRDARWQLQVSALASDAAGDGTPSVDSPSFDSGPRDVTRQVTYQVNPSDIVQIDASGFVTPLASGSAVVTTSLDGFQPSTLAFDVSGMETTQPVNFPNQVVPVFTKLGCNGGGCHGKAAGQAGFKLSLLGFEPQEDFVHLVKESRGRRVFPAVPQQSLLLLKATNQSPHGGGQRLDPDSQEYRVLQRWIASGMTYGDPDQRRVTHIEVVPAQVTLQRDSEQQLSVIATYSDGSYEDITRTAQYESNNNDLGTVDTRGMVSVNDRPGDVAIMTRYQGQVAVFRASIPLGVQVDAWPKSRNVVDELVFSKLKTLGIPPSTECDDATYIRRVTLDLCGRLPTSDETETFLTSTADDKFEATVDSLLTSVEHAEFFAKKWSTILRNRRPSAGHQFGTFAFYDWLRDSFYNNVPYDQFVGKLLTASGSIDSNPPVAWFREVATTEGRVEDAAQLFLGQRLQCARCHHHPFEKWSQADYFHMAAFFSTVTRREGETPEQPRFVSRVATASAAHPKSGESLFPAGLDATPVAFAPTVDPREELVQWMVAPDNPFFARSLVNRYWKHFFAVGLVEPEDDMRVTNPASNPELLDGLAQSFIASQYDLRQLLRLICTSTTYRLRSDANEHNLNDHSYARYYPKRLQAEVLLDAVDRVLQTDTPFAGVPAETRAVSLPDNSFSSYFLNVFGKPDSTTACECERAQDATLAQSLHLLNSKEMQSKLSSDSALPASLAASSQPVEEKLNQLYMTALSRSPSPSEIETASDYLAGKTENPRQAYEDLVWAILNSKEFLFNH